MSAAVLQLPCSKGHDATTADDAIFALFDLLQVQRRH
jgi:hypothetical protein